MHVCGGPVVMWGVFCASWKSEAASETDTQGLGAKRDFYRHGTGLHMRPASPKSGSAARKTVCSKRSGSKKRRCDYKECFRLYANKMDATTTRWRQNVLV